MLDFIVSSFVLAKLTCSPTIGSTGLSLDKQTSFVAQIDNRHLYFGDTGTDQYAILID